MGPEAGITCWGNVELEFCLKHFTTFQNFDGFPPLSDTEFKKSVDFTFLTRVRHLFLKCLKDVCQSEVESVNRALAQAKFLS